MNDKSHDSYRSPRHLSPLLPPLNRHKFDGETITLPTLESTKSRSPSPTPRSMQQRNLLLQPHPQQHYLQHDFQPITKKVLLPIQATNKPKKQAPQLMQFFYTKNTLYHNESLMKSSHEPSQIKMWSVIHSYFHQRPQLIHADQNAESRLKMISSKGGAPLRMPTAPNNRKLVNDSSLDSRRRENTAPTIKADLSYRTPDNSRFNQINNRIYQTIKQSPQIASHHSTEHDHAYSNEIPLTHLMVPGYLPAAASTFTVGSEHSSWKQDEVKNFRSTARFGYENKLDVVRCDQGSFDSSQYGIEESVDVKADQQTLKEIRQNNPQFSFFNLQPVNVADTSYHSFSGNNVANTQQIKSSDNEQNHRCRSPLKCVRGFEIPNRAGSPKIKVLPIRMRGGQLFDFPTGQNRSGSLNSRRNMQSEQTPSYEQQQKQQQQLSPPIKLIAKIYQEKEKSLGRTQEISEYHS